MHVPLKQAINVNKNHHIPHLKTSIWENQKSRKIVSTNHHSKIIIKKMVTIKLWMEGGNHLRLFADRQS